MKVTTHEAKSQLSRLIRHVLDGEDVVICRGDRPVARLVAIGERAEKRRRPVVGEATSEPVETRDGAFDPLTDEELREWGL